MEKKRSKLAILLIDPFRQWSKDNASTLAAALAYYTVISLVPLLVIIVLIAGYVFKTNTALDQLSTQVSQFTSPQVGDFVKTLVKNASDPTKGSMLSSIVSVVVLIFGASGIFSQLQSSLNKIWNVPQKNTVGFRRSVWNHFLSFLMVVGLGILLILFIVVDAILSQFIKDLPGGSQNALPAQIINGIVMFAIVTVMIAMIFRVVPDREISWGDVWLGAAFTALLFLVGRYAIGYYLSFSKTASGYGAAGSLIVLLLWIYYSAQILFLGAEFTQVYAENMGPHRNIETINPEEKPEPVESSKNDGKMESDHNTDTASPSEDKNTNEMEKANPES